MESLYQSKYKKIESVQKKSYEIIAEYEAIIFYRTLEKVAVANFGVSSFKRRLYTGLQIHERSV